MASCELGLATNQVWPMAKFELILFWRLSEIAETTSIYIAPFLSLELHGTLSIPSEKPGIIVSFNTR